MASLLNVQILTLSLWILAWVLLVVSVNSPSWATKSIRGNVNIREGLMKRCIETKCEHYPSSRPRLVAHSLVYIMFGIMALNILPNIGAIFIKRFRSTAVFGFSYSLAALFGMIVLMMYPTSVQDMAKDGNMDVQLSWGYFVFMIGDCMLIALAIECFQVNEQLYPNFF